MHLDTVGRRFSGEVFLLAAHAVEFALVGFLLDKKAATLAELEVLDLPAVLAKAIAAGLPSDALSSDVAAGLDGSSGRSGTGSDGPAVLTKDDTLAMLEELIEHCTVEVWGPRLTQEDAKLVLPHKVDASAQEQA